MGLKIIGKNSVLDAIESKLPIAQLYVQIGHSLTTNTLVKPKFVDRYFLDKLTSGNHQGYVAELLEYNYYDLQEIFKDKPERVLILDHIEDPQNFGSILRICNAANVRHIIIAKDRQVRVTPTVLKVSSGGFVGVKVILVTNLIQAIDQLKKNKFWIYGAALNNATSYKKIEYNKPYAIVIGNENKGLSVGILKHTDQNVVIPLQGTVQSLNAAIATAILLFS